MCLPAAPLALIGTALSAVGTGVAALQANAQANYQAQIAERNAGMEREAAQQEQENTRQAALAHYRQVAQLKGQQIVGAAANGVSIDFGTAGDTLADTEMLSREDAKRIYQQGNQNVRGHDIGASNYMGEANAQRQAGKAALIGGAFKMGSTVLGGASQYAQLRANLYGARLMPSVKRAFAANAAIF